jgi:trigger factor
VVVQRLGLEAVQAQAIEQFGDRVFEEGLEESGLEPIAQASLEEVTWEPAMALHLTVPVGPVVTLGTYQDVRIPWRAPEVTDEELDEELARLQRQQADRQASERPAELGDEIVADITATVEGETVLENAGREMVLDAESPYPVPGFAKAVVGIEVDETREFTLTYPQDHYNADVAGKEGHFSVRVSEIRTEVLPELDDEFAMLVGDYEDLADLRTKVRQSLQESAEYAAEQEFEDALWRELIEIAEIEYPDVFADREVERMQNRFAGRLQGQGIDMDSFFQLTNTTEEEWRANIRPQAIESMKRRLILDEVAKAQELAVEEDEIQAEIEETLEPLGDEAGEMRELLESEAGRSSIREDLLRQKALEYLKTVTRVEAEAEETALEAGEAEEEKAAEGAAAEGTPAEAELAEIEPAEPEAEEPEHEEVEAEAAAAEAEPQAPEAQGQEDESAEPSSEAQPADGSETGTATGDVEAGTAAQNAQEQDTEGETDAE